MITRNDALQLLVSFFRGDPPFEETTKFVGHASSGIPEVFLDWFGGLADAEKELVAEVLVESIIQAGALDQYLQQACCLMVATVARYPSSVPQVAIANVERLLRPGDLLRAWLDDTDGDEDDLKDFRLRWRYALALWNLLWLVGSPLAAETFQVFTESAKDAEFARSIRSAKKASQSGLENLLD